MSDHAASASFTVCDSFDLSQILLQIESHSGSPYSSAPVTKGADGDWVI